MPADVGQPQVITAIQSHHYLDTQTRVAATRRCYDLLEPGGIYVTFENVRMGSEEAVDIAMQRWMRFQVSQGRDSRVVEEHKKRFGTAYYPITIDEHIALLRECGFRVAELFWFSHMQAGFYAIK